MLIIRRISTVVTLVLLLGAWATNTHSTSSPSPSLSKIRYTVAPDRTRIVLDLSGRADYKIRKFANPDRIAINLTGVRLSRDAKRADINDGVVRRVRINRLSWGTQVVLDLRHAAEWNDLYLVPVDGMPNRIVVDVKNGPGQPANKTASTKPKVPANTKAKTTTASSPPPARMRPPEAKQQIIVAIDPGHGGKDPGTTGKYKLREKDVVLDISRRVARKINEKDGFKAVMTRDSDVFLNLVERTRIAKKRNADIFVSIHLNSAPRRSARGVELFLISPAGAEATAKKFLSNRKNAARELGLDAPESDDIMHMLVDVNQQAMMQRSLLLGEEILKAMDRKDLPPVRSVKQKSFAVLKSVDIPSVLVEAGFLSNSKDASIFKNAKGRQAAADAIAAGIISYLRKYPPPPDETGRLFVHKVRRGDTLWGISKQYSTSVASIRESNRLGNKDVIRVGQELVIRERHDGR